MKRIYYPKTEYVLCKHFRIQISITKLNIFLETKLTVLHDFKYLDASHRSQFDNARSILILKL